MTKPVALTIAGSDSGGGAGIQADIKAMEANGVYAASVLTAVTAQNTEAVQMAYDLPEQIVGQQIDAVADDLDIRATKTGMLSAPGIIETIAERVQKHDLFPFIVDPVMVSKSGFKLLKDEAVDTLKETLIPLATVVTPNVHEASLLAGYDILTMDDVKKAARDIFELGPETVLVKGGHLDDAPNAVDVLYDGESFRRFSAARVDTSNTHGTGCTFASAIAAHVARGSDLPEAIDRAKRYLTGALRHSLDIGRGHGPTNHFFHLDADLAIAEVEPTAA
jgi:hydroxymethylpyrimidine/phosphomethylpyrimidine kinase